MSPPYACASSSSGRAPHAYTLIDGTCRTNSCVMLATYAPWWWRCRIKPQLAEGKVRAFLHRQLWRL